MGHYNLNQPKMAKIEYYLNTSGLPFGRMETE